MEEENKKPSKVKEFFHRISFRNIHEVTLENDIKYRGPLSYRHLRAIGWFVLFLGAIGIVIRLGMSLNKNMTGLDGLANAFSSIANMMAPLFLIAAFSRVIVVKNGYPRIILTYVGFVVLVYIAFIIVYQHYLVGLVAAIGNQQFDPQEQIDAFIKAISGKTYLQFNIFIDLLLCTLVSFFLIYTPKKHFQGKKRIIFRLFVLLPILYEAGSIAVKILTSYKVFSLSPFIFPLLTTKPPVAFLIFIVMVVFIARREKFFLKKGYTKEDYKTFLKTNVNSLHFSIILSLTIIAGVILDAFIFFASEVIAVSNVTNPTKELLYAHAAVLIDLGLLKTLPMLGIIPLLILFDYKKEYKDFLPDLIIPAAGIVLLALTMIEGGFEVIKYALINKKEGDPTPPNPALIVTERIKELFIK